MPQEGGLEPGRGREGKWKQRLSNLIQDWKRLRNQIEDLPDQVYNNQGQLVPNPELNALRDDRRHLVNQIRDIATSRNLVDFAIDKGFRADFLRGDTGNQTTPAAAEGSGQVPGVDAPQPGGGGGGGDGGDGTTGDGGSTTRRNPPGGRDPKGLPGIKGKDFTIIKSHKGVQYAVYSMKVEGNTVRFAIRLPRNEDELRKYGVKKGDGRPLTKQQFQRIEVLGGADELIMHGEDKNPFKGLRRFILNNYEGAEFLDDDEVAGKVIAQHIFGWTPGEFQNQLKNTKWYERTSAHQRMWQLDMKNADRQALITDVRGKMLDWLEDNYGLEWQQHVQPSQVKKWAERVASGQWGTTGDPSVGFDSWVRKQFKKAAEIEGTPAWRQRQSEAEEVAKFANRPEEMFERLRTEAMGYLGYDKNNTPRIDRGTLQQWAGDLVTGAKSEGDWAQFLRHQMKNLHPYFDHNLSFTEQASPYKSIAERTLGDTLDWNDRLLRDFTRLDANGNPTDKPMSLHDYELKVRQDNRAWKEGTQLWEEGLGIVQGLEAVFKGIG